MGVPGALKNAIDWTIRSADLYNKPVALITASSSGEHAHNALLDTLLIIGALMTSKTQLRISFIKSKVDSQGNIGNMQTTENIKNLMHALIQIVLNPEVERLKPPDPVAEDAG